ncbi:MAG: alpha/beta fold hydrolase [Spirochaetia bacterium]|jgi:pimeloyl-ACP methyl ester carboxylesterase
MAGHPNSETTPLQRPWYDLRMMPDPILDQVLLFYLSEARHGMTDIGEVLDTAGRVRSDDELSWTREWMKTAERVRAMAEAGDRSGHPRGAGAAYVRAAAYYRAALHRHPDPSAPEIRQMAEKEVASFGRAITLLSLPAQPVRIPYEGTTLPGYFFRPALPANKAPVLVVHQGRDAWAEDDTYIAREALARGWQCLLVDGPGMGQTLRLQGLPFRPDWEKVITPVVDFAVQQPGVDPGRIALMGISMGGALASRAAAFEKRLKLLIVNPGVYEWSRIVTGFIVERFPQIAELPEKDPEAFNAIMKKAIEENPFMRWGMRDMMWKHGCGTPAQLMVELKRYTNRDIVEKITARTLVIDGEAEEFGQARELYEALRCPKDYLLFTALETAQLHVQTGATAVSCQRVFSWLEDNL